MKNINNEDVTLRRLIDSKIWLISLSIHGTTNKEKLIEYNEKMEHLQSLKLKLQNR